MFASVARLSELATEVYDIAVRPWVRATVTQEVAQATRDLQPIRLRRSTFSDLNPFMGTVGAWAEEARGQRQPVDVDNPFAAMERVWATMVESQLNLYRDVRDAWLETLFHSIYSTPAVKGIGRHELQGVRRRHGKARPSSNARLPSATSCCSRTRRAISIRCIYPASTWTATARVIRWRPRCGWARSCRARQPAAGRGHAARYPAFRVRRARPYRRYAACVGARDREDTRARASRSIHA
ncbi:DUF3141 domain-containing protein [Paraburkholderia piptadeniae]|uniref:DUF3141 domain-containing protein n=1 Tax=Paraburkholderia piptadeniae TaxID=1701573 RepID=UPI000B4051E5